MKIKQIATYFSASLIVNGSTFLLAIILFNTGLSAQVSSTMAFITAVGISIVVNNRFTFKRAKPLNIVRFSTLTSLYVLIYFLNMVIVYIMFDSLKVPYALTVIISTVVCGGALFLAQKLWIYNDRSQPFKNRPRS